MQERVIGNFNFLAIHEYFMVFHVEPKMEMPCGKLHSIDPRLCIKEWPAALPPQTGGAHFDACYPNFSFSNKSCDNAINGKDG
jgi:hypothetical protein